MEGHLTEKAALARVKAMGLEPLRIEALPDAKHIFSHIEWRMCAYRIAVSSLEEAPQGEFLFVDKRESDKKICNTICVSRIHQIYEGGKHMKLLSVAIPCYNSEAYMSKCINSLLIGGEEVEIIIVDDGSSDRTAEIADDYAEKYPTIVKAIHQENGGHGQAVNTGIKNATGLYFKVVDSDDWVNQDAYYEVLKTLYELIRGAETVDLLISNFVYEKQGATRKKVMQY